MTAATASAGPRWLLDQAFALLDRADDATAGRWSRAAALLARQALEVRIDELCDARDPKLGAVTSARAQLLCLRDVLDPGHAFTATHTWLALSHAVHQHAYDLPPTADELRGWCEAVDELLEHTP